MKAAASNHPPPAPASGERMTSGGWLPHFISLNLLVLHRIEEPAGGAKPAGRLDTVAHWPVLGDADTTVGWKT
jgi:hypothetical protein